MRHFLAAMLVAGVGGPVQAQTSSNPSEFLQLSGERQSAYVEGGPARHVLRDAQLRQGRP